MGRIAPRTVAADALIVPGSISIMAIISQPSRFFIIVRIRARRARRPAGFRDLADSGPSGYQRNTHALAETILCVRVSIFYIFQFFGLKFFLMVHHHGDGTIMDH